jgi:hypothetical protein
MRHAAHPFIDDLGSVYIKSGYYGDWFIRTVL